MCGIYGAVLKNAVRTEELDCFRRLGNLLSHRGPDDARDFLTPNCILGFNRLSIVDVESGQQPIKNVDESVVLIGNGEIYNYQAIRLELEERGHLFSTGSDIECLLHSYLEYGMEFLADIRGMFAFAILDQRVGKLILGRDRLGEKPLYFSQTSNSLWFSSESSALIRSGIQKFSISPLGISRFFKYGFITSATPLVNEIREVEPGTILIVDIKNFHVDRHVFWNIEKFRSLKADDNSFNYKQELEEISSHIFQGEVPIGVALSGGIDSSLLVSIAKKLNKNISVITIGYNTGAEYDESKLASKYSSELGFNCTTRIITAKEVGMRFSELAYAMDEPIADPSAFGYFILGEEARKLKLKVLLSGHGPDELYWGYKWISDLFISTDRRIKSFNAGAKLSHYIRLPKFKGKSLGLFIDQLKTGFGIFEDVREYLEDSRDSRNENYSIPVYSRAPGFRKKVWNARRIGINLREGTDPQEAIDVNEIDEGQLVVRETLIKTYLRVNGLAQIDRLWMANSIEGRSLLVDYKLVENSLTDSRNSPRAEYLGKQRFRELISDYLSSERINRRKQGFTPPVRSWYWNIYLQNRVVIENSMLVRDGLLPKGAQRFMRRPLTVAGRPRTLWLEMVTLEFWYRKNFS
jgi:asparagine synthase (glutamine-hydrolysing)